MKVEFAGCGALPGSNENRAEVKSVTSIVQTLIDQQKGVVKIDNKPLGDDSSKGNGKHLEHISSEIAVHIILPVPRDKP